MRENKEGLRIQGNLHGREENLTILKTNIFRTCELRKGGHSKGGEHHESYSGGNVH